MPKVVMSIRHSTVNHNILTPSRPVRALRIHTFTTLRLCCPQSLKPRHSTSWANFCPTEPLIYRPRELMVGLVIICTGGPCSDSLGSLGHRRMVLPLGIELDVHRNPYDSTRASYPLSYEDSLPAPYND